MKNSSLYIILLAGLLSVSGVWAQNKAYKGEIKITPLHLEQVGDSLHVGIDFDIGGVNVKSRRSISLIPVLVALGVERRLPEVQVKGRADLLCSKRHLALMSRAQRQLYDQNPPSAILKGYNKNNATKRIQYQQVLAFEPWMKDARLDIREDLRGCGNPSSLLAVSQLVNKEQLERIIEPYVIVPSLAYVQPETEAVKKREMVGEAFLDFVVSKTDIRADYMNNSRELKKITDMMTEVRNDPAVTVRSIFVVGYASPEGTLKFNQYLSENRAKSLVDYLAPRFDYPKDMYYVEFGGENWDGLLAAVETSDMTYRDEVIRILQTVPAEINVKTNTSRKKSLMSLRAGEPYRYLLKEFFPSLRKAICKIDYEVKGFEVTEAKEVFRTRPENLSLNELYLVANTYEPGSAEFVDVFETAARMFPEDETANLNAAAAALSRNDIVSAERHLNKVRARVRIPEYDNAMGVLEILRGDYNKAESYLQTAADAGLENARYNLEEVRKKLENIALLNGSMTSANE